MRVREDQKRFAFLFLPEKLNPLLLDAEDNWCLTQKKESIMNLKMIILKGEWDEKPYVKVWIDRTGKVCFSPLIGKEDGWNFMASMYISSKLSRTGVESNLKKKFKKQLSAGKSIPKKEALRSADVLARRLNRLRVELKGDIMVANLNNENEQEVL